LLPDTQRKTIKSGVKVKGQYAHGGKHIATNFRPLPEKASRGRSDAERHAIDNSLRSRHTFKQKNTQNKQKKTRKDETWLNDCPSEGQRRKKDQRKGWPPARRDKTRPKLSAKAIEKIILAHGSGGDQGKRNVKKVSDKVKRRSSSKKNSSSPVHPWLGPPESKKNTPLKRRQSKRGEGKQYRVYPKKEEQFGRFRIWTAR